MPGSFRIGDWVVEPSTCLLLHGERRLKVSPRAMDVLVYLARRAGEVIPADELLTSLWPYTVKSPNAVAKVMTELRHVLDEVEPGTRLLETVPKRGYRFSGSVVPLGESNSEHGVSTGAAPEDVGIAPAVLAPAEVPAARAQPELWQKVRWPLAAGIAVLIALLLANAGGESKAHHLTINDRVVVFTARAGDQDDRRSLDRVLTHAIAHFKKSGATDLGTGEEPDYRLELSLNSAADVVRASLSIRPTDPEGRDHLEEFEVPIGDRSALVDSLLRHTVEDLNVLLDSAKLAQMREWGTTNIDAYRLAAEGDSFMMPFSEHSYLQAAERYKAAIAQDPNFGNAYSSLATVYANLAAEEPDPDKAEQHRASMREVRREMSLASVDPEVLETMNRIVAFDSFSSVFDVARYVHGRLMREPDNVYDLDAYVQLLYSAKLFDESEVYLARAMELDQEGLYGQWEPWLPTFALVRGDHAEYVRLTKRLNNAPGKPALRGLVLSLGLLGRSQEAEMYLARLSSLDPLWGFTVRTMLMAIRGELTQESAELKAFLNTPGPLNHPKGNVCFILGDVECGVRYWQRMEPIWLRMSWVHHPGVEATFAPNVVTDPRYQAMLELLGIGRSWRAYMRELAEELAPVTGIAVTSAHPPEDLASARASDSKFKNVHTGVRRKSVSSATADDEARNTLATQSSG